MNDEPSQTGQSLSLTPCFSGVAIRLARTGTALAVSDDNPKTAEAVPTFLRLGNTPLKRGVNESVLLDMRLITPT